MRNQSLIRWQSKRDFIVMLIIIIMVNLPASAQTCSLHQILDSIRANNPGLQQFALKTISDVAMSEGVKSWPAPTLGAGLSEFPYGDISKINNGMMARKMVMVQLSQMFPNFSFHKDEQEYQQSFANQNRADQATMSNMLFAKAKVAYYDIYINEKKLTIIREQEMQLQLLLKIAKERLSLGKSGLSDIYKTQAKLSELKLKKINLGSVIRQSTAGLNGLMNRPLNASLTIDTSVSFASEPVNILDIDSVFILSHRSDIQHTTDEIYSLQLEQKMTSKMGKPEFGFTWDNMRMPGGMYMYDAMAMVSIPIAPWFSRGYKSKIRAMDYQAQAMQKMKEEQILKALTNIRKDWLSLQSTEEEVQIFQEDVLPAYEKTYLAYLNAYSENNGDIFETLDAWTEWTMKRMEYFDKLDNMLNIEVMLETEIQNTR